MTTIINAPLIYAIPEGFVYLKEIDPTIIENLRYFSNENFIGRKIEGYKANRAILTYEAAKALSKVQQELLKDGYCLVIYNAYMPKRTVEFFKRWRENINDQTQREKYYPAINKADIFKLGYLAERANYNRGSTVDVTIIKRGNKPKNKPVFSNRLLKDNSWIPFLDDGTVDMRTL